MSILRIDKLGFHKTLKFKNKEDLRQNLADYFSDIDEDIDPNKHNKYDDMNLCYQKQDEIIYEFTSIFENFSENKKNSFKHKGGKSTRISQELNSGEITITCVDWDNDIPWKDHLRVTLLQNEFINWLRN